MDGERPRYIGLDLGPHLTARRGSIRRLLRRVHRCFLSDDVEQPEKRSHHASRNPDRASRPPALKPEFITLDGEILAPYTAQTSTSKTLINNMTHEVCASVPFYFNYHKRDPEGFGERPPAKASAGYLLM